MSHFAKLNNANIVTEIIVAEQDFINSGNVGDSFRWIQTSYNDNYRKQYCGVGYTYDKVRDAFVPAQAYASWTLNVNTNQWEPPKTKPDGYYLWDEVAYQADNNNGWVEQ